MVSNHQQAVRTARSFIRAVRDTDAEMPAQTLATLFEIAADPGITMADLEKRLGLSSAAMSRIVSRLSEWDTEKTPGLNFVVRRERPDDRRYKIVDLTSTGREFIKRLVATLTHLR